MGDDYYLVNSSFEFFPGVPIFHSRDLVHWQQIGYCLTRKSQLNLDHARASGGIYAPTLRYHNGTFYMITTLVDTGGNFFVTATNPAGPWSEPVWVDHAGIDPSLFFDEDGTVYYDRHEGMADGFIGQAKINLQTGKLDGDFKEVWRGTGGVWPEGPHLYKINGKYFIMIAEGGTSYDHMVTIARSDSPWGRSFPTPRIPFSLIVPVRIVPSRLWVMPTWWKRPMVGGWSAWESAPKAAGFIIWAAKHFWPRSPGRKMAGPWSMARARWKPT